MYSVHSVGRHLKLSMEHPVVFKSAGKNKKKKRKGKWEFLSKISFWQNLSYFCLTLKKIAFDEIFTERLINIFYTM